MRLPGRREDAAQPADAGAPADGAGEDARFMPGGTSQEAARDYAERVGLSDPADREEDPRRRAARLRRRRRLLTWGGIPAFLVIVLVAWMSFVSLMTIAANRAIIHEDYPTAVSRYQTVARVNPWLEQWRVHYNLGTAHLLADQLPQADTELVEALDTAPKAGMVSYEDPDGATVEIRDPMAPECLVRVNLYITRMAQAGAAEESGDASGAEAFAATAVEAAGECETPPQPEPNPTQSPTPTPTQSPTSTETPTPTPTASQEPSTSPSPEQSGSPTPDPSASASASPSPTAGQEENLRKRNEDANDEDGAGNSGGRRW